MTHERPSSWSASRRVTVRLERPIVLGIMNLTPDSFHAASRVDPGACAARASAMVSAGAVGLDLGAESTRPGASRIGEHEQSRRLLPALRAIRKTEPGVVISVDTTRSSVARAALDEGADAINDVSAGSEDPGIFGLAAERGAGLILMHRRSPPEADSYSDRYAHEPEYRDVAVEVGEFLTARARAAMDAGVAHDAILVDPGLGFGKTVAQNLELIARTGEIAPGFGIVSGLSRKSFVGRAALGRDSTPEERLAGTLELSLSHAMRGARVLRVHDVGEHSQRIRSLGGLWTPRAACPRMNRLGESVRDGVVHQGAGMGSENVLEFTDANFSSDVLGSPQVVLVDFWAEWCQPCKALTPAIEQIAAEFAGKVRVGKMDIDANHKSSMQCEISAIPTVILFKGGAPVRRFVGLTSKDVLAGAIREVAG